MVIVMQRGRTDGVRPVRVLLAEDYSLIRAGLRALVESIEQVKVIAEASDGQSALDLVAQYRPDIVLMDIEMPQVSGLEATAKIAAEYENVQVIILSMYITEEYVVQAMKAGARGYVMKDADISELRRAFETVMKGQVYLTPAVSLHVADYLRRAMPTTAEPVMEEINLTPRQTEIIKLIADGYSTKEIAETLHISIKTAETHRANIMKRLDIYDIAGLTRYALRVGLAS